MEGMKLGTVWPTTVEKIRGCTFKTVRRGFDPGEVKEYLSKVADRVQALEDQARSLDTQLTDAMKQGAETAASAPTADSFESVTTKVAQLMRELDADVEKIREEARAETGLIILDAKAEASRIEAEAHRTRNAADHALLQARSDAEREMSEFKSQRKSMRSELRTTSSRVRQMVAELEEEVIGQEQDQRPIVLEEATEDTAAASIKGPASLPEAPN